MTSRVPGYGAFIDSCLHEASEAAVRLQRDLRPATVKADDENQVVTRADVEISATLVSRIHDAHPDDSILEEESGIHRGGGDIAWVVDPLDGTSNYAAGSPLYGLIVAAVDQRGVLAGGIALPALGDVYLAERGRGASSTGGRSRGCRLPSWGGR